MILDKNTQVSNTCTQCNLDDSVSYKLVYTVVTALKL